MIEALYIGLISAFLTMFLNYCIGKPGSKEFSPYEIFSFYTVLLSVRRLKQVGIYNQYSGQYHENLKRYTAKHEIVNFKREFDKVLYDAAEPFFTWERAAGMCTVCTGFWVSLGIGLIFMQNISELIEIIVISHVTIRILNKIL